MEATIEKRLEGTRDMLPEDHKYLTFLKKVFRHEFRKNGFRRISTPIMEETALLRKVYPENNNAYGLYHFKTKDEVDVSLLPSASVGIMRSYIENEVHDELQPVYYYYIERCFRQARQRKEQYVIGGEIIGETDPIIDAQNVYMIYTGLKKIGLWDEVFIRINSYGIQKEMDKYYEELESFLANKLWVMSPETAAVYETNKFAVFHSQDEDDKILASSAPSILKFLKKDSKNHHEAFKMYLDDLGIPYTEDHTLFFPETFYSNSIWQLDDKDGKKIATGGRYNTLAKDLWSIKDYPAAGFTLDVGHVIDDLKSRHISIKNKDQIDLYFVQLGDEAKRVVFPLSLEARAKWINTMASLGTPSIKEQMLKAQRIGSTYVVLVGLMEARNGVFQVRNIPAGTQEEVKKEELIDYIIGKIGKDQLDFYEPSKDLQQNEAPKEPEHV
jgi:histidyl-tRNA synthetase